MITKFKIYERLGILESLEDIARNIFEQLTDKSYYQLDTKYRGVNITLHCYKLKKSETDSEAFFRVDDKDKHIYTIKTSKLDVGLIAHELKHLDYELSGSKYKSFELNYIGQYVTSRLKRSFGWTSNWKTKSSDILIATVYMVNPDEFSAYYHSIYYYIKDYLEKYPDSDKRETIDKILNNQDIYTLYNFYYKNGFVLKDFFKTNRDMINYLKILVGKMEEFKHAKDNIEGVGKYNVFTHNFISLINQFRKDIEINEETQKIIKNIEDMINNEVQKNYKKFHRLYALFD